MFNQKIGNDFANPVKYKFFRYFCICIASIFIFRLGFLQIVQGNFYKMESEAQAIKPKRVEPFRGNIFDRNDVLFVHNSPSFGLSITPGDFKSEAAPLLANILKIDTSVIYKRLKAIKNYSPFIPIKIQRDLDFETLSLIEEYSDHLRGVEITVESKRLYDFEGNMSHMLGYTREISREEIEKMQYYKPGDIIGKTGLEYSYESFLRGREGVNWVAVNKFGEQVSSFMNGKEDISSNNGFDLKLGIDLKLQQIAEAALGDYRGSVIAIDPRNGEVIVFVSKPDFDPRQFTGRVDPKYYKSLVDDPGKPLLHRAISSGFPPGSSWKMMVAAAALEEGLIDENTHINCSGGLAYGDRVFKCMHVHGNINVVRAIQGSCNVFFYSLGIKLGMERMIKWGRIFGFGQRTGIDIPNEGIGNYPEYDVLKKRYKGYLPGGMALNFGIGQGDILATPLQMAVYTSILANKGQNFQPHLVKEIFNNITRKSEPVNYKNSRLPISIKTFDLIQRGMYEVVNLPGGTASRAKLPDIDVCGKTSTAQNPHGKDHAWFISFAPYKSPTIAMAVMVENAGFGGQIAAPISAKVMDAYFHPEKADKILKELLYKGIDTPSMTQTDTINTITYLR